MPFRRFRRFRFKRLRKRASSGRAFYPIKYDFFPQKCTISPQLQAGVTNSTPYIGVTTWVLPQPRFVGSGGLAGSRQMVMEFLKWRVTFLNQVTRVDGTAPAFTGGYLSVRICTRNPGTTTVMQQDDGDCIAVMDKVFTLDYLAPAHYATASYGNARSWELDLQDARGHGRLVPGDKIYIQIAHMFVYTAGHDTPTTQQYLPMNIDYRWRSIGTNEFVGIVAQQLAS